MQPRLFWRPDYAVVRGSAPTTVPAEGKLHPPLAVLWISGQDGREDGEGGGLRRDILAKVLRRRRLGGHLPLILLGRSDSRGEAQADAGGTERKQRSAGSRYSHLIP